MTTGRDPMTPMGLYVSKTLLSEVETRGQRRVVMVRVVMVRFVYEFRLDMLSVASVVVSTTKLIANRPIVILPCLPRFEAY